VTHDTDAVLVAVVGGPRELAVDEDLVAMLVWIVDHGKVAHDRNPTSRWLPSQHGLSAE
jgi:hypothetical protein